MLFVLTLLALYAGVVQSFSWDIVISRGNRLEFYNEGTLTYSAIPTLNNIHWITHDPLHNRVLFRETVGTKSGKPIFSYDIATGKTQTLINFKHFFSSLVYDPARELLFASISFKGNNSIQSFLVRPGSDAGAEGNHVINLPTPANGLAVDKGSIYWITECTIDKIPLNGSEREIINNGCNDSKTGLAIDPQTQKIYWAEKQNNITEFFNADLNGNNKRSLYKEEDIEAPNQISVSKDFIYWMDTNEPFFWQLPKNTSLDTGVKPKRFALDNTPTTSYFTAMASNYAIEEQTQKNPNCKALKSLLPTNPESPASSDTCDVPVCHNYCLQGHCSTTAEGQPKCRCKAGYSGQRCEVDACLGYCLHEGVCSLNKKNQPVCRCSGDYEGDRCDVSVFLTKFFHHFVIKITSMFNEAKKTMVLLSTKE